MLRPYGYGPQRVMDTDAPIAPRWVMDADVCHLAIWPMLWDQLVLHRQHHRFCAIAGAELGEDIADMQMHCAGADT
jgi:hypothetical protein